MIRFQKAFGSTSIICNKNEKFAKIKNLLQNIVTKQKCANKKTRKLQQSTHF